MSISVLFAAESPAPRGSRSVRKSYGIGLLPLIVLLLTVVLLRPAAAQLNNGSGNLRVRLVTPEGSTWTTPAHVQLMKSDGLTWVAEGFTTTVNGTIDFLNVTAGDYHLVVTGDGIESTDSGRFEIVNRDYTQTLDVAVKVKGTASPPGKTATVSATELAIPPAALQQFHKASELLAKKQWARSIKPLQRCIALYPKFAAAYHDLGVAYSHLSQPAAAREAWQKSVSIDDHFAPSYISLGELDIAEHNLSQAEAMLKAALAADPTNSQVRSLLANVELLNGHYDDAIAECSRVHSVSKEAHELVHLIAAQAYEHENRFPEATKELQAVLAEQPNGPLADKARAQLLIARGSSPPPTASNPASAKIEVALPASSNWAPPDIDLSLPETASTPPCSLPNVLQKTDEKIIELVDNLQKFSADEEIEHMELDKNGDLLATKTGYFKYVAEILEVPPHRMVVNEYRNSTLALESFPSRLVTRGTAAFALIFHSNYINDFNMQCEGFTTVQGHPAWQIHFAQRPDKPSRFRNYYVAKTWYPVTLKGRAWIAANNYQVLRMETDLVSPIKEIELKREHLIIEYHAVDFRKRGVQLWLPASSDIYLDYRGHRYHDRDSFSNFQLFWIETDQKDASQKLQSAQ